MVTADMHLHSKTSFDGRSDIEEMCHACVAAGLATACFTEHDDAYSENFSLNVPKHKKAVARAKAAYPQLTVLTGIEAGYSADSADKLRAHIATLEPDYILLSLHAVEGIDPYDAAAYYRNRTREQGIRIYLETMLEAMDALESWDALAHIGYVCRYPLEDGIVQPLRHADAPDLIDEILLQLIQTSRALEVNTSGVLIGRESIPGEDILARYRALGGEIVALGSDAHHQNAIAGGFDGTAVMLRRLGFARYAVYQGRVREDRPLA